MKNQISLLFTCGALLLGGCVPSFCAYVTGVHNQSPITYRVRETGALIPSNGHLGNIHYRLSGDAPTEALHLDPVRYTRPNGEAFPLVTPQERQLAFRAWLEDTRGQSGGYTNPDTWVRDWIGGPVVVHHRHSTNPWGGPSITEMASNDQNNSTAEIRAARLHLQVGIGENRAPWIQSRLGVCP